MEPGNGNDDMGPIIDPGGGSWDDGHDSDFDPALREWRYQTSGSKGWPMEPEEVEDDASGDSQG